MGMGDDLIFLGKAEEIYKKTGKKIVPLYHAGWSPLYDNVEFISKQKDANSLTMNARDINKPSDIHVEYYTKEVKKTILGNQMIWRPFTPSRFAVRLSDKEIEFAENTLDNLSIKKFVLINPDYKSTFFSKNKNWGFSKYQEVANILSKYIQVVRIIPGGGYKEPILKNAINIKSENIKNSIAIMRKSKFGITYDGFVTHVLSGYNIPVVNIQGGFVNPTVMNYEGNINLYYKHFQTPCGSTFPCRHCDQANDYITINMVIEACKKLL